MQIWVEKSVPRASRAVLRWRVFHRGVDAFLGLHEDIYTYLWGRLSDGGKEERDII